MTPRLKSPLLECVAGTSVFAAILGIILSCGGTGTVLSPATGTRDNISVLTILSHLSPGTTALPSQLSQGVPLVAMAFQGTQPYQQVQIQQSFQGLSCDAFEPGSKVNQSNARAGFIPIQVLSDPFIMLSNQTVPGSFNELPICAGVFSQVGGGRDLVSGGTLTSPGTPVFGDGTLSTLIVTGRSVEGQQIGCSDLQNTAPVHGSDLIQPYFVIENNSVVLAMGSSQLSLHCQLNIATGDQAGSLSVNWVKM